MQWLYDAAGARCDETVLQAAAERNQVDAVVWIFENVADARVSWLRRKDDRAKVRRWLGQYCASAGTRHHAGGVGFLSL